MAKYWRQKIILCKTEVTYATEPAGMNIASAAMLVFNFRIRPMQGQDVQRKRELGYFSGAEMLTTGEYVEMTFDVELAGNAVVGDVPKWSAVAKACGLAETVVPATSVTYNPVSTGLSSSSMHVFIDGVKQAILGCRGTAQLKFDAHQLPMMSVTMWGLYQTPSDTANPAGAPSDFQTPQVVNYFNTPTFTLNGVAVPMRSFNLDLGRRLAYRNLVGVNEVLITDGEASIATRIEAQAMATLNPYALAKAQTAFAVNLVHGTVAGKIVTVNAPNCFMHRPDGSEEQDNIQEWPLAMSVLPQSGSDDFTIALT